MSSRFIQRGGVWVLGQGALLAVVCFGVYFRQKWTAFPVMFTGSVFLLLAIVCGVAGTVALGRNLTPFPEPAPRSSFVQNGIYGVIRHPLYTAVFCGAVGWAMVWRSAPAFFAALALAPFFAAKARREEHILREKFPEYAKYEQRVRRFIPWVY